MTIIKIESYENGSHDNNTIYGVTPETFPIPEGYAIVPETISIPSTFPFVHITIDNTKNPPEVTSMEPGEIPEIEPEPYVPTAEDRLNALESAMLSVLMGG